MVNKFLIVALILSFSLALSACEKNEETSQNQQDTQESSVAQDVGSTQNADVEITFSDEGFSPGEAEIKAGQTLKWTNKSSKAIQVASDPHPAHSDNRDITGGEFTLNLQPGESKTIIVAVVGSWEYHDHLNPAVKGKVIVE